MEKNNELQLKRCSWCLGHDLYLQYHDQEWGKPVHADNTHFEFLVLESAQAGLSWITILKRRENYRQAYDFFDPVKVAGYDSEKKQALLTDTGIIRNRLKIEASINNAQKFGLIQEKYGSFDQYVWNFVDHQPIVNQWNSLAQVPAHTPLSDQITKSLKQHGFKFIGTTIIYSYLQAVGIVNDHLTDCFRYKELINENDC